MTGKPRHDLLSMFSAYAEEQEATLQKIIEVGDVMKSCESRIFSYGY